MENADRELIRKVCNNNIQLRRLYQEHKTIEEKLSALEHRNFLTPHEEIERKRLKVNKLKGVDKMMNILSDYREEADAA